MITNFTKYKLLLEKNINLDNIFELTFYNVVFHTDNSSDNLYNGLNYNDAVYIFEKAEIPSGYEKRTDMSIEISKQLKKFKFIYELDEDYETIENYPIEEYYNDKNIYKLISEEDYEIIDNKSIEPLNKKSDEILNTVQYYFYKKYGKYKYNHINIYDNDDNYLGCINLRITDHTENIFNVDRFGNSDYHISVVISDFDITANRFGMINSFERKRNEYEFKYDSEYTADNIIEEINEKIEEITNDIKNK
jgi:hypothetical protein